MRRQVVALAGLSGVGKSTLLTAMTPLIPMQVLQASGLIRHARETLGRTAKSLDELRSENLVENQELLARGFEAQVDPTARLIILDCHTVIESEDALVLIDPRVFGAVGITAMIFLVDHPDAIVVRRQQDATRQRPETAREKLGGVQDRAVSHAKQICDFLHVPLHIFQMASELPALKQLLQSFATEKDARADALADEAIDAHRAGRSRKV